jgi:hypothetical protein
MQITLLSCPVKINTLYKLSNIDFFSKFLVFYYFLHNSVRVIFFKALLYGCFMVLMCVEKLSICVEMKF